LSCELVDAAPGADGLALEDLREAVGAFRRCVCETAGRHDGFVAGHLGYNLLVLFGYPTAHEHDAEQAVRTGLELCAAVKSLSANVPMRCRIGIATGLVIAGDLVGIAGPGAHGGDHEIVGEAPNAAARLQAATQPDTVAIGPVTRQLIGKLFDCRELGAIDANNSAEPLRGWQVLRESIIASRFEALRGSGLSPLVGRDEEIDLLLRRWGRAKAADGQIVLVSGEAGVGKSRIATAFEERLRAEPHLRRRYFCSPHHQDSALFPFIDQLGRAAGFARDDMQSVRLEKLGALLAQAAPSDEDAAFFAELLSLPSSERHKRPPLSPQRKKERILEALIRQLEGLARRQPVLMIFEDAHWIDPTSRELLDLVVERVPSLPVLLIVTFRPEFQPPWTGQPQLTMVTLNRLDRHDRIALVEQITRGKVLPDEVVHQIADRTDGVPLFVEELTKSVLESGLLRKERDRYVLDRPFPTLAIPTTLHASLTARLDRLGSARRVAQIGAAIGREFPFGLLRVVARLPEGELHAALASLVASELVFQRGAPPAAVYTFKHALVQDAAHDSLLRTARRRLHGRIAEALEAHSPELMDTQPELFALHYAEAGIAEKSVTCWGKAARRSAARSAMAEAAAQFHKGLDQLALLPDTPERRRQELEFWSDLGAVLQAVKGQAAPETGRAYTRARELWEQLDCPLEFLQILYGQSRYHLVRGEIDLALRLDQELLHLSRHQKHSAGLVLSHLSSGRTLMFAGRFAASRLHLEETLTLCEPNSYQLLSHQAGIHPHVSSQAYLGFILFCLGYPDQAFARSNAAIAEARKLAHPTSLAVALAFGARLLLLAGDDAALDEREKELAAVAAEQSFPYWNAQGAVYRGWVKVKNGDVTEGISLLRSGSTAYRVTGAELYMPHYIALLAAACEIAGQIEEASSLLHDALQIVERTGEGWLAAELNRRKGHLLLRQGECEAAEEFYRKARNIAEQQGAKLWELRAALSLARLRRDQRRRAEARDLIAPVYNWFTEGFDTPDLTAAKALLSELDDEV
jgi:class 3 adenylate cyclase/predicted ATPase